jgi:hypothetical protein
VPDGRLYDVASTGKISRGDHKLVVDYKYTPSSRSEWVAWGLQGCRVSVTRLDKALASACA